MQVEEESSEESSEEEVRTVPFPCVNALICGQVEEFYSPGSLELLESRRRIAEYSLPRLEFCYR